ncbi:MAG TPA: quinol oxidase subunit 4 [Sphingobacteriaceae bacterium]
MKHTLWVLLAMFLLSSCMVYPTAGQSGKVPPGQAKKMSGSKSAKKHAPGQKKKHH